MRVSFNNIGLVLAAICVGVTPLAAQHTGTRIGRDATAKDGRVALDLIAKCLVERQPRFVREWLEFLPGTSEEHAHVRKMNEELNYCMSSDDVVLDGKQLRVRPIILRLPVARSMVFNLLRQDTPRVAPTKDTPAWYSTKLSSVAADAKFDSAMISLQDFGHCLAVSDWRGTQDLLTAEAGSPAEKQAITRLRPHLSPCLPQNVTLTLNAPNLRDVLAEPVYHIIAAHSVVSSAAR